MTDATVIGIPPEVFVSKRDAWLVALLWATAIVDVAVAGWLLLGHEPGRMFVAPLLLVAAWFQVRVLYATHYTFEGPELRVRASFFRWRVPLAEIDSIEPTTNPLSNPACSLDRLLIRYGKRHIMISPDDKHGFLRALAARAPQLEVQGEHVRRRGASSEHHSLAGPVKRGGRFSRCEASPSTASGPLSP